MTCFEYYLTNVQIFSIIECIIQRDENDSLILVAHQQFLNYYYPFF